MTIRYFGFFQITVRFLLAIVSLAALLLGMVINEARQQALAVTALKKVSCEIVYSHDAPLSLLAKIRYLMGEKEYRDVSQVIPHNYLFSDSDCAIRPKTATARSPYFESLASDGRRLELYWPPNAT